MPVVNREVVLPVDRERAWELITEPAELEEWLGDDVEFEAEEDAPLRVGDREGVVEEVADSERIVFRWGDSRVEWRSRTHLRRHPLRRHRAPLRGRHHHLGPEAHGARRARRMLCPA